MTNFLFILKVSILGIILEVSLLSSWNLVAENPGDILADSMLALSIIGFIMFVAHYKFNWGSRA